MIEQENIERVHEDMPKEIKEAIEILGKNEKIMGNSIIRLHINGLLRGVRDNYKETMVVVKPGGKGQLITAEEIFTVPLRSIKVARVTSGSYINDDYWDTRYRIPSLSMGPYIGLTRYELHWLNLILYGPDSDLDTVHWIYDPLMNVEWPMIPSLMQLRQFQLLLAWYIYLVRILGIRNISGLLQGYNGDFYGPIEVGQKAASPFVLPTHYSTTFRIFRTRKSAPLWTKENPLNPIGLSADQMLYSVGDGIKFTRATIHKQEGNCIDSILDIGNTAYARLKICDKLFFNPFAARYLGGEYMTLEALQQGNLVAHLGRVIRGLVAKLESEVSFLGFSFEIPTDPEHDPEPAGPGGTEPPDS